MCVRRADNERHEQTRDARWHSCGAGQARSDFLATIPRERWTEAGAVGFWTVKDLLGHLAVWTSRAITALYFAERGEDPRRAFPKQDPAKGWDPSNAIAYEEQKERPLERIEADFRGSNLQLLKRIEQIKDDGLIFDPNRFPSLKANALLTWVWASSGEHDAEHRHDLEQWMAGPAIPRVVSSE
ncbi:MAG: maleylpyruvate isomerase N-terminal domain-containing protein [Anaerolineae bacterium]|nr:maleylpyruvate isomerase N-terminal domain-containing protein [Anaerolineae bacterium]